MEIKMKKCGLEDVSLLQEISIETFRDTFESQNKPENIAAYLKNAYQREQLEQELLNPESSFFFLLVNGEVAGYLKINQGDAQSESMGTETLEVERIYIRSAFKRKGLGTYLINQAIRMAESQKKQRIWLGVWEKNLAARSFYEKMGFVHTGDHVFNMGDEEQTDYILTKEL